MRTTPFGAAGLPIRTLRVEVVEGPDAGAVAIADTDVLTVGTAEGNDLRLSDATVSRYHAELCQGRGGVVVRDHGSTNGTTVGSVHIQLATVPAGTIVRLGASAIRVMDGQTARVDLLEGDTLAGLRGRSPVMRRLMARIRKAAQSDVSVLLCGESGTGKELIAQALHRLGPRVTGPLVTVDCGSLAPTLVASELFGHERGAFTGAEARRIGAFERADGGTLFLDEIGELPPALQTNLLGVLERRRLSRLGDSREIPVDVRVVAATNRDLRAEVNRAAFRLDLYYRLAVVKLDVPALRERRDDVPLLVEHFLRECGHPGPAAEIISEPTMSALLEHHWPGNVRELKNLVEATIAMGETPEIEPSVADPSDPIGSLLHLTYQDARSTLLGEFERRYLKTLVARAEGNVSRAAREARMDRSHLIDLLRRHGLR